MYVAELFYRIMTPFDILPSLLPYLLSPCKKCSYQDMVGNFGFLKEHGSAWMDFYSGPEAVEP